MPLELLELHFHAFSEFLRKRDLVELIDALEHPLDLGLRHRQPQELDEQVHAFLILKFRKLEPSEVMHDIVDELTEVLHLDDLILELLLVHLHQDVRVVRFRVLKEVVDPLDKQPDQSRLDLVDPLAVLADADCKRGDELAVLGPLDDHEHAPNELHRPVVHHLEPLLLQ